MQLLADVRVNVVCVLSYLPTSYLPGVRMVQYQYTLYLSPSTCATVLSVSARAAGEVNYAVCRSLYRHLVNLHCPRLQEDVAQDGWKEEPPPLEVYITHSESRYISLYAARGGHPPCCPVCPIRGIPVFRANSGITLGYAQRESMVNRSGNGRWLSRFLSGIHRQNFLGQSEL